MKAGIQANHVMLLQENFEWSGEHTRPGHDVDAIWPWFHSSESSTYIWESSEPIKNVQCKDLHTLLFSKGQKWTWHDGIASLPKMMWMFNT